MGLKDALAKKYGESVSSGNDAMEYEDMVWFNTGSHTLNKCINPLGRGIPTRCITEFFGDYATGKTLISTHCIKDAQAKGAITALIDVEGSFTKNLVRGLGVDLDNLIVFAPVEKDSKGKVIPLTYNTVEDRINDIIDFTIEEYGEDKPICIVWDSLAATNSERDIEETKDQGANAKEIKAIMKRLGPKIHATNTSLIIINQIYDVISRIPVAETTKATGGRGTQFQSHIRVSFIQKKGKAGKIEDEDDENTGFSGVRLHFYIDKNRVGQPFGKGTVDFIFDVDGKPQLDYYSGYMDYLIDNGLVDVKSSKGWIKVGDDKYRKSDIAKILKDHPELL